MDKDKDKMAGIPAADERDPKPVDVDKVNSDALTAEDSGKVSDGQPGTEVTDTREGKKPRMSRRERRLSKKAEREQILRIRELEELMSQTGGDVDPEKIVSMYVPHRRRRRIGAALLRMDRWRLILLGLLLVVCVLFIVAFMQEKMGNFTINLNRLELYRKGISIADTGTFDDATARLTADTVVDATNISIDDIPDDVDELEGSHNGKNYMAYTFYIRNAG